MGHQASVCLALIILMGRSGEDTKALVQCSFGVPQTSKVFGLIGRLGLTHLRAAIPQFPFLSSLYNEPDLDLRIVWTPPRSRRRNFGLTSLDALSLPYIEVQQ